MNDETPEVAPLCSVCQTLELSKANNREPAKYQLGTWEDVIRKANEHPGCPFCVLMRLFAKGYGPSWYETGEVFTEWKAEGGFFFKTGGDNLVFLNEDTAESPYGSAREVQSRIDPFLFQKWLKLCEVHHDNTCTPKCNVIKTSDSPGVKVLRVIDTEDHCIVQAVPGLRYLTLSYVWGPVIPLVRLQRDNVVDLSMKGALLKFPKLPRTISDAIDLVRLIGERYLWVDSLCLIQDDPDDMLDGIHHMDLVYQCAILTIIAAHGEDSNAGLPGLHPGSRDVVQDIVEVLPGIKMTQTTGVYNAMTRGQVGGHTFRAWTLQELVLSHRTLIFTKNRVYFRCRANCWSEDTTYDNFPTAINEVLDSGTVIKFLSDNEPEPLAAYYIQVFRYTQRKLTKASDTIHGLTGILRFLSVQAKSALLEGLFTAFFDISLLFWDIFPDQSKPERQDGFPSWSWAGWRGVNGRHGYGWYDVSTEDLNCWLQEKTYIVWYKRNPGTAELELVWGPESQLKHGKPEKHHIAYRPSLSNPYGHSEPVQGLQTEPDDDDIPRTEAIREEMTRRNYHFLNFFAYVVFIQAFGDPGEDSNPPMHKLIGADGKKCGLVQFDDEKLMKGVEGPYEFVLLSKMDGYNDFFENRVGVSQPFYWAMLIVWHGEKKIFAERRGFGCVFQDCLEQVLHPGKVWKEIVLV